MRIHFLAGFHPFPYGGGVDKFACGRMQQICVLAVTEDPSKVTCRACLKRMRVTDDMPIV